MSGISENIFPVSIFYEKKEWPNLILKCVVPYFQDKQISKHINGYYCHLSTEQGDHVRVSIRLKSINSLHHINPVESFKKYLISSPSVRLEKKNNDNMFMDIPNNTVIHGLYQLYDIKRNTIEPNNLANLRNEITRQLSSIAEESDLTEESLFSYALYMQITLIVCLYDGNNRAIDLRRVLNSILLVLSLEDQVEIERRSNIILEKNAVELRTLYQQLTEFKPNTWLTKWQSTCLNISKSNTDKQSLYFDICNVLYEHFNIRQHKTFYLSTHIIYLLLLKA